MMGARFAAGKFLYTFLYALAVVLIMLQTGFARERRPRIEVVCLEPPVPVVVEDTQVLVYELHITNFAPIAIELTGAEFSLLQLLISRPGSTFSRQELIPRVLSRQESGIDRSIDSLVSNLRRKLGPSPDGTERIRSVRGVGYVYVIAEQEAR